MLTVSFEEAPLHSVGPGDIYISLVKHCALDPDTFDRFVDLGGRRDR